VTFNRIHLDPGSSRVSLRRDGPYVDLAGGLQDRRTFIPLNLLKPLIIIADVVLILALSVLASLAYHALVLNQLDDTSKSIGVGLLFAANFVAVQAARGNYSINSLTDTGKQMREAAFIWCMVFLVVLAIGFFLKVSENFSRGGSLAFAVVGFGVIIGWRALVSRFIIDAMASGKFAARKCILIGELAQPSMHPALIELRRCGYSPLGTFQIDGHVSPAESGCVDHILDEAILASRDAERIFLFIDWSKVHLVEAILDRLRVVPIPVSLIPDERILRFLAQAVESVEAPWMIELKKAPLTRSEAGVKRVFDVIFASVACVLLLPMMLTVALLIRLDSSGPALFRQTRNGFNGRSFKIFKFRTMRVLEEGNAVRQATRNDARVTRLGRWLRRTSIDELPQLLNVIAGDMSLIGPRPHATVHNCEYEKLISNYAYRHHMKPGISGWAQVNGLRGETQTVDLMSQRVNLDLWYINNWSFWLDIRILVKTIFITLRHTDAY
jgi:undecaprenyl-phosphate galactose phosphotransferase/putative colanic acid biosynthesis UDP-glucose lipid carrier transferase